MQTTVTKIYKFSAGHHLPFVRDGHKCKNPHGHNYKIEVDVIRDDGKRLDDTGMVIDFFDLDDVVAPHIQRCDHCPGTLNGFMANPTAELIAEWFFARIENELPDGVTLRSVTCWEEDDCKAVVWD